MLMYKYNWIGLSKREGRSVVTSSFFYKINPIKLHKEQSTKTKQKQKTMAILSFKLIFRFFKKNIFALKLIVYKFV